MSLFAIWRTARAEARAASLSPSQTTQSKSERLALAVVMVLATFGVLASRRTTTLTTPYIWAEDGLDIVPQFVLRGWSSLLDPISGYMALIPRLISYVALSIAPQAYPFASTALSWVFMAGVLAFIALAPIRLRARPMIALACLFVPTEPEVFGTSLYSFWWAGLILMLLTLWESTPSFFKTRLALAAICGLSTPVTILIAPLLAARALLQRTRHDTAIAVAVIACAALQLREIFAVQTTTLASAVSFHTLMVIFDKFFGRFVWGLDSANVSQELWLAILGIGIASLAMHTLATCKDRWLAFCLLYLLGGSIALSVMRVSVEVMSPTGGGPRYFFYPYVILSWILIQGLWTQRGRIRSLFAVLLVLAVVNAATSGWNRATDPFSWEREVLSCAHFDMYGMPVYISGSRFELFQGTYVRKVCEYLAADMAPMDANDLQPFTWLRVNYALGSRHVPQVAAQTVAGTSAAPAPDGYTMIGSYDDPKSTGELTLNARRGDQFVFASGAAQNPARYDVRAGAYHFRGELPRCPAMCTLSFTSDLLPDTFTVTLSDSGTAPDEWFAIGVPKL